MQSCIGITKSDFMSIREIRSRIEGAADGKDTGVLPVRVKVSGAVHVIRDFGDFSFVIIRNRYGLIQTVADNAYLLSLQPKVAENSNIIAEGEARIEGRAPNGFEIVADTVTVLSVPFESAPVSLHKNRLNLSLDTGLPLRPYTLRHMRQRAIFKIQEGIVRGFRDFLCLNEFTEIRSPKIVRAGAEGGSNIFKLDYFGRKAYLAQSPQFYKQTMAGVYDRVFEVGPVFRAEKHNTVRHLNEYTSLDFEMGYITSFTDIMEMETAMLKYTFALLQREYPDELKLLGAVLPAFDAIPMVRFDEVKEIVSAKYDRAIKDPYDLQPEEEQLIGRYFKEEYGSDLVFVTHYPSKKRPFYAMDDPENDKFTLSFDLLLNGMEITTGGQRIHDYISQTAKMIARGMDPADFESYLMIHKYGMPPHGGLGLGLERLTMQLLGESNVRSAVLFPRDQARLDP
ncbi:MAG: aspartate--tRNA(Asn) ligase [Saccharofermentanales bacterium]